MKADIHPDVRRDAGALLAAATRSPPARRRPSLSRRAVQRVPSLLHRQAEAGRHRRPHRAVRAPLRPPQVARRRTSPRRLAPGDRARRSGAAARPLRRPSSAPLVARPSSERRPSSRRRGFPGGAALDRHGRPRLGARRPTTGPPARWQPLAWARRGTARRRARTCSSTTRRGRASLARRASRVRRRRPRCGGCDGARRCVAVEPGAVAAPIAAPRPPRPSSTGRRCVDGRPRGRGRARVAASARSSASRSPASSSSRRRATPALEVGVGRYDREAFAMMHGDLPDDRRAGRGRSTIVRGYRRAGRAAPPAEPARARALAARGAASPTRRWSARPSSQPVERPCPGRNLTRARRGHGASATDADGAPVVVACSVGVDLDLVPDRRRRPARPRARRPRWCSSCPSRDAPSGHHRRSAAALAAPAEVVAVAGDWRSVRHGRR